LHLVTATLQSPQISVGDRVVQAESSDSSSITAVNADVRILLEVKGKDSDLEMAKPLIDQKRQYAIATIKEILDASVAEDQDCSHSIELY
jgi:hypothetical protein